MDKMNVIHVIIYNFIKLPLVFANNLFLPVFTNIKLFYAFQSNQTRLTVHKTYIYENNMLCGMFNLPENAPSLFFLQRQQ